MFTTNVVTVCLSARESRVLQAFSANKFVCCVDYTNGELHGRYFTNIRCSCDRVLEETWFASNPDVSKLHVLDVLSYIKPPRHTRSMQKVEVLAMQVPERWRIF